MEVDDGDQFEADFLSRLHDNASTAGGGTDQKGLCAKCGCETAGNKKCNLCDIVHVLWHGDRLWKEVCSDEPNTENHKNFMKMRDKLQSGQVPIPEGWKASPIQQVVQDKETIITKTPCGCVRALSKEAYKQAYGKEPSDDGIEPCSFELPHGGTMQAFKVWHGLRDAYDIKVEEKIVLRHRRVLDSGAVTIDPLQQTTRFASRSKLVLQPWDSDLDLRKVPLEPALRLVTGTQHALPAPPVSDAPLAPESSVKEDEDEENEEEEMRRLGLDGPVSKKRRVSGTRAKRSKEEMYVDEVEKLKLQYHELLDAMKTSTPNTTAITKFLKVVEKKMNECKEKGVFDASSKAESMLRDMTLVKDCVKVAQQYISAKGLPRDQHKDAFWTTFQKVPTALLHRMPHAWLDHYIHLSHAKDLEAKDWAHAVQNVDDYGSGDVKTQIAMVELLFSKLFLADIPESEINGVATEVVKKLATLSCLAPEVSSSLELLASVVTQKVPQGETTFDRIIDTVEAQSGGILIRVLMKDGAPLFESYKAANTILQNREKIATVVENIKIKLGQLPSAGSSALKDASVEMQKLIQQQLRPEDVESHESIDKHLKEIFNTFSGMVTGELKTVISSVDALLKTEKILEVEHPFSVDGLASLGKDLLDDKQFPTSKYWNNIAQAREKVVNLLTLAGLATDFLALMKATDGEGKARQEWLEGLADYITQAKNDELAAALESVLKFSQTFKGLPVGFKGGEVVTAGADLLGHSRKVVADVLPTILPKMMAKFDKGLLRNTKEFVEKCPSDKFLPALADFTDAFVKLIGDTVPPAELKSVLTSMWEALQSCDVDLATCDYDQKIVEHRFAEHELQTTGSLMASLVNGTNCGEASLNDIKDLVQGIHPLIVEFCEKLGGEEMAAASLWLGAVVDFISNKVVKLLYEGMTTRIGNIPEAYEQIIQSRNLIKIKSVFFAKETHQSTVQDLDVFVDSMKDLAVIFSALGSKGLTQSAHLGKMKGAESQLKVLRTYAATTHGISMVMHRFSGKSSSQKSALAREFKKKCDANKVVMPRALNAWVQEEIER